MSIKIKDLAKELEASTDKVIEQLRRLYVDVEDENSKIDAKIAALIRHKLGVAKPVKTDQDEVSKKEDKKKKAAAETKAGTEKTAKKSKTETGKKPKEVKAKAEAEPKKEPKAKKEEKGRKTPSMEAVSAEPEKVAAPEPGIRKVGKQEKIKPVVIKLEKDEKPKPVVKKPVKPGKPKPHFRKVEKRAKERVILRRPAVAKVVRGPGKKIKLQIQVPINIRDLAPRINKKPGELIQYMMSKGIFSNINQDLEEDVVRDLLDHFGCELQLPPTIETMEKEIVAEHHRTEKTGMEPRAPVITFMGHVDHGKTSLLDYIRNAMVAQKEKGGITQHIGAYKVDTPKGSVTFLDTPGHEAFTAMRARGANATDVVVLVVAADDGVMPQTKEAIDHARAAEVPIVIAINKCDLPDADTDQVKRELQQEDLVPEEWGGKTIMVEVSAKTGEGIDELVEMLMLESELLELQANPKLRARGVVIESKKTPGQGVAVTLLVKNGTLRFGDVVLSGAYYGKVKAMINDLGERVTEASPATPVEMLGLQGLPEAGEEFFAVKDEKKARTLSLLKQGESRREKMAGSQRVTLEDLHSRIAEGSIKELKMVLKADVQGSVEALQSSLEDLATKEVKLKMIHSAVGNINESDVMLAMVSNAVVIGFHVKTEPKAEELAKSEKVDVHIYDVIYEAIADVTAAMEGLLEPEEREVFQGSAQVREIFATKGGKVAGCMVVKGTIHRKDRVKLKRAQETVYEGEIDALKRFKDDVKDVKEGFECGISLKGSNDIRKNDIIEAFVIEKIARRLDKKS